MAKVYLISSPEQLKAAAECVKWSNDKRKVLDFATVWSATIRKGAALQSEGLNRRGLPLADLETQRVSNLASDKPFPFKVTLELGRQAILFREKDGAKTPLGTMLLKAARKFVKGLVEDDG